MTELIKSPVVFDEVEHRYWLNGKELHGITSTLIKRAFPDKYKEVDPEVLANAARKGKELHAEIEYHDNFGGESEDVRVAAYDRLKLDNGLTTIANEYTVSDEDRYASQIDIVLEGIGGEICLADIKTTFNLDKESTAMQLSIYKRFFEMQNPDLKVARIYVIWLPNRDHTIAEIVELPVVADEVLDELFNADAEDKPFEISKTYGDLPAKVYDVQQYLYDLEMEVKAKTEELKAIKEGLCSLMIERGVKSFSTQVLKMTAVTPKPRETFDTKRFAAEHPELYKEYVKIGNVTPSIRITYK